MRSEKKLTQLSGRIFSHPKIAGTLVFSLLLLLFGFITNQRYLIIKEAERQEMRSMLNVVKQNIDQSLKNSYTATLTLALTLNDQGVPVDFQKVGAQLVDSNSMLQAVQLVPDGIIKYTYPLKGNEMVLGINVFKESNQIAVGALKTIGTRKMYFSGPIKLKQGGYGIIGRLPLFNSGKFWGFSAVVLKLNEFLKQAGVYNIENKRFFFQFSKVNEKTGKETFFLPARKILHDDAYESIFFPDGDWKLYIVESDKLSLWLQLIYPLTLGFILAMICGVLTVKFFRQPEKLRKLVDKQAEKLMESELRFKTIFDKAPIGIAEVETKTGAFKRVNQKFCNILGYTEKEFYLTDFQSITFDDDLDEDLSNMQKLKSGKISEFSLLKRYRHKNGHVLWANLIVKSLWNDGECPTTHIGIVEDVTERMAAEQEIKDSQQRTASLINTIDGIVWEANPENLEFTFISKKSEQILGYTDEEWLASPTFWLDHLYPEDRAWVVDYCLLSTKSMKPHDFEYRMLAKDGTVVWLRDIVNVIAENNKPVLLRGIMIDVTNQKQAEKALNESFKLATEQNKRLLNFSYIVSHNLRSHAGNIEAVASLIDVCGSDEERTELVSLLKRASTSLNETLMNLNQVVNIRTSINISVEPLNLDHYIHKILDALNEEIVAKDATISIQGNCNVSVSYNPAYLESILLNFIFNAVRYSHPDRKPLVKISCFEENNQTVLQIADNGIGINLEKHRDELFGMYKTFTDNPESKGIGLFMSKNQIDAMGGSVTVSSVLNEGTTFNIYFK